MTQIAKRNNDNIHHMSLSPPRSTYSPTVAFLCQTLVERTRVHKRNSVSYVTLRTWRTLVKRFQLSAFRALKSAPSDELAETIAQEMYSAIEQVFGRGVFDSVVPVPCGRSSRENCLSTAIAERLAARLSLPRVLAISCARRPGSSHPIDNVRRPRMTLVEPISGPALLIDDVATSGRHLEEAAELLRPVCGSVFALAWIGGVCADEKA